MDKIYRNKRRLPISRRIWRGARLTAVLLGISVGSALAQVSLYGLTTQTGQTYTSLTGGTALTADANLTSGTSDDGYVHVIMPFSFTLDGYSTDSVTFSTNYWIALRHQAPTASQGRAASNLFSTTLPNRTLAAWFRDGNANFGAIGLGEMRHGLDPNATGVYVFEWFQATGETYNPSATQRITFQIRLFGPTSSNPGRIEYWYGPNTGATSAAASIGIENGVGGTGNYLNALTGSSNSTTTSTEWPGNGFVYRFDPPSPMLYTGSQVLSITGRTIGRATTNQSIAVLNLQTAGALTPLDATNIQINTGGTNLSNISNLKVYYTGSSTAFSTTTQFGTTVASPSAFNAVTGTQVLGPGNNYFWVTYDVSATATIGDSLKAIIPAATVAGVVRTIADSALALPRGVAAPLSGTVNVGNGQTHTTLTSLFTAINNGGLSGNLIVNITSNITEPGAAGLNEWINVGGGPFKLDIRPTGGARKISGDVGNSGVIVLSGADRVTIDGRIGGTGTGQHLTIENTNTTLLSTGILLAGQAAGSPLGGCTNVTIRNCVILAGTNTSSPGSGAIWTQGTGLPNDSLVITENIIKRAYRGLYISTNTPSSRATGVRITKNTIGSSIESERIGFRGIHLNQANQAVVEDNLIFDVIAPTSAQGVAGIELGTNDTAVLVQRNSIRNVMSSLAGSSSNAATGILVSAGNSHQLINNEISGVFTNNASATTAVTNAFGVRFGAGTGHKLFHNSIHMFGEYTNTNNTVAGSAGVSISSTSVTLEMRNNLIVNKITTNATGNKNMMGIWMASSYPLANLVSENNNIVLGPGTDTTLYIIAKVGTTFGSGNYASMATWRTTGKDLLTTQHEPAFVDNLILLPNSVALNNAAAALPAVTTDILGNARSATTPDHGAYEYTPANVDASAIGVIYRTLGCYTANEPIRAVVRNTGLSALNLATNPLTVTIYRSGVVSDTITATVNSGTIAVGDTMQVLVGVRSMTAYGTYTHNGFIAMTGDGISLNNTLPASSTTNIAPVANPFGENFESGTLLTGLTNWVFGNPWVIGANNHGNPGNGLYFNLYDSPAYLTPTFTLPKIYGITATTNFSFSYRLMNYTSYPQDSIVITSGDSIVFELSTDCGVTFTRLHKIDSNTHVPSRNWSNISVPIGQYAGQEVTIRVRGQWAVGDYYLDLDNIVISEPLRPFALLGPASNTTINTGGYASSSISAGWNAAQTGPVVYRWQLDTISGDFSNPYLNLLSNSNGADTSITLTLGAINDFLDSRGIAVGGTLAAKWRVTAAYGAQLGISTNVNNLTLVRGAITPNCPITIAPVTIGDTVCGVGATATLGATSVGPYDVVWYDGTVIRSAGNTIEVPNITVPTAVNAGFAGRANDSIFNIGRTPPGTGTFPTGMFSNGMYYRALSNIRIDSITLFSNGALSGVMQFWNANPVLDPTAVILQEAPFAVAGAGVSVVPMQAFLTTGSYYVRAVRRAGTGVLFRTVGGSTYPYVVNGRLSIDSAHVAGTNGTSANYYYFYNLSVSDICLGPTAPANATIEIAAPGELPYAASLEAGIPCNFIIDGGWQSGTAAGLSGTGFTIPTPASGTGIAAAKTAGRLISPSIPFGDVTATAVTSLTFDAFYNGTAGSKAYVEVSTDGGQTFTKIDSMAAGAAWQAKTVSLNGYALTPMLHVVFNHAINGGAGSGFAVDNIQINSVCNGAEAVVKIRTDIYGTELSWTITDSITGNLIAKGGPYPDINPYDSTAATHVHNLCLPSNAVLKFRIEDSYGDGLWDGTRSGTYDLSLLCPAGLVSLFSGADSLPYGNTANPPQYDTAFVRTACFVPDTMSVFNLLTPANSSAVTLAGAPTQTVDFTWQASTRSVGTEPVTYTWTLETATGNPVAITSRSGLTSPNVSLTYLTLADTLAARGLLVGGTFNGRWKVVANSGALSKDAVAKFNISITRGVITSVDENELGRSMNLYPNPTSKVATLAYNFNSNVDLKVVVVNAIGQEVLTLNENGASRGELSLDVASLQEGLYFVRITDGVQTAVKRLMIQR